MIYQKNCDLTNEDVLIGKCEGYSAIIKVYATSALSGLMLLETEHGDLYLDPDQESVILGPHGLQILELEGKRPHHIY